MSKILKVLYVEDDSDDARILRDMLQVVDPIGFHITVCRSQRQAIAQLEREAYDLLFVDYWLKQTDHTDTRELVRYVVERSDYLPLMLLTLETKLIDEQTMQFVRSGRVTLLSKRDLSLAHLHELVRTLGDRAYSMLLVDDDPDDHVLIDEYLKRIDRCRFLVTNAYSLAEAQKVLREKSFDVCLVDWRIGKDDSREFIRQAVQINPTTCITLLTNTSFHDIPSEITEMVNRRNLAYLCKRHLTPDQFEEIVMTQLYRTHLQPVQNSPEIAG